MSGPEDGTTLKERAHSMLESLSCIVDLPQSDVRQIVTDTLDCETNYKSAHGEVACGLMVFMDQVLRALHKHENSVESARAVFENVLNVAKGWSNRHAVDAVMQMVVDLLCQQKTTIPPLLSQPHALQLFTVVTEFLGSERRRKATLMNSDRVLHALNNGSSDYSEESDMQVRARLVLKLCAFQYRTGLKAFHEFCFVMGQYLDKMGMVTDTNASNRCDCEWLMDRGFEQAVQHCHRNPSVLTSLAPTLYCVIVLVCERMYHERGRTTVMKWHRFVFSLQSVRVTVPQLGYCEPHTATVLASLSCATTMASTIDHATTNPYAMYLAAHKALVVLSSALQIAQRERATALPTCPPMQHPVSEPTTAAEEAEETAPSPRASTKTPAREGSEVVPPPPHGVSYVRKALKRESHSAWLVNGSFLVLHSPRRAATELPTPTPFSKSLDAKFDAAARFAYANGTMEVVALGVLATLYSVNYGFFEDMCRFVGHSAGQMQGPHRTEFVHHLNHALSNSLRGSEMAKLLACTAIGAGELPIYKRVRASAAWMIVNCVPVSSMLTLEEVGVRAIASVLMDDAARTRTAVDPRPDALPAWKVRMPNESQLVKKLLDVLKKMQASGSTPCRDHLNAALWPIRHKLVLPDTIEWGAFEWDGAHPEVWHAKAEADRVAKELLQGEEEAARAVAQKEQRKQRKREKKLRVRAAASASAPSSSGGTTARATVGAAEAAAASTTPPSVTRAPSPLGVGAESEAKRDSGGGGGGGGGGNPPEAERTDECVVCFRPGRTHVCVPCGHLCLCDACSAVVRRVRSCPVCRAETVSVVRVFAV